VPIEPDERQLADIAAIAGTDADGPVVMLNLNRYRDRDEYMRYGIVAAGVLDRVGGRIQWHADAQLTIIGDESDRYDEVLAVWYPNRAAFLALIGDAETVAALPHRVAGLERAAIICCSA
jgi:hypothetical protein